LKTANTPLGKKSNKFTTYQMEKKMAATVFVWKPKTTVGHASMGLSDGTYISWWPTGNVFDSDARSFGMRKDKNDEGSRNPDYASAPINGLDEDRISLWWKEISGRKPGDYSPSRHEDRPAVGKFKLLSGYNCSNMVVRAMVVGGIFRKYPLATVIIANNLIMTPIALIDVSESITGNAGSKIGAFLKNSNPIDTTIRSVEEYIIKRL
jgi:hypothetical protein